MTDGRSYQLEDCELLAETDSALLVYNEEIGKGWIPLSQVEDRSELSDVGDDGCIEITGWMARKLGLE